MSGYLETWVVNTLSDPSSLAAWDADQLAGLVARVESAADLADAGDRAAREDLHRAAYRLFVARHSVPWQDGASDTTHPMLSTLLWVFTNRWVRSVSTRYRAFLDEAPRDDVDAYVDWVTTVVQRHRSNVTHPLFEFLADEATYEELRTFLFQETPFDIHFADIICSLLAGVHGEPKYEIAANFWDEMGNGDLAGHHRTLRLAMTDFLGLASDAHVRDIDAFVLEEIELANAYFLATFERGQAPLLLGMLLATESMVPGRLDRQIDGWRRVGVAEDDMRYLLLHTVVDVAHATGWIDHVIRPVLHDDPSMVEPITLGVALRLELAEAVCDRLLDELRSSRTVAGIDVLDGLDTVPA